VQVAQWQGDDVPGYLDAFRHEDGSGLWHDNL
jgi:hypothetical protein